MCVCHVVFLWCVGGESVVCMMRVHVCGADYGVCDVCVNVVFVWCVCGGRVHCVGVSVCGVCDVRGCGVSVHLWECVPGCV